MIFFFVLIAVVFSSNNLHDVFYLHKIKCENMLTIVENLKNEKFPILEIDNKTYIVMSPKNFNTFKRNGVIHDVFLLKEKYNDVILRICFYDKRKLDIGNIKIKTGEDHLIKTDEASKNVPIIKDSILSCQLSNLIDKILKQRKKDEIDFFVFSLSMEIYIFFNEIVSILRNKNLICRLFQYIKTEENSKIESVISLLSKLINKQHNKRVKDDIDYIYKNNPSYSTVDSLFKNKDNDRFKYSRSELKGMLKNLKYRVKEYIGHSCMIQNRMSVEIKAHEFIKMVQGSLDLNNDDLSNEDGKIIYFSFLEFSKKPHELIFCDFFTYNFKRELLVIFFDYKFKDAWINSYGVRIYYDNGNSIHLYKTIGKIN